MHECVIIKFSSEEELESTSSAVVGSRRRRVLWQMALQAGRAREHRGAQVAGEGADTSERVLDEMCLQTCWGAQRAPTQATVVVGRGRGARGAGCCVPRVARRARARTRACLTLRERTETYSAPETGTRNK